MCSNGVHLSSFILLYKRNAAMFYQSFLNCTVNTVTHLMQNGSVTNRVLIRRHSMRLKVFLRRCGRRRSRKYVLPVGNMKLAPNEITVVRLKGGNKSDGKES